MDALYLKRCFDLALLGKGKVSPNPLVGCVIVHQDKIIGEGWHQKYGEAHAEVNAVRSVENREIIAESTVYVNLEPCSHFGKTPPCAELLLKYHPNRVVISNQDPNPLVAGKGIALLQKAGIAIQTGVLQEEGYALNKRFFTFFGKERPYIILKWAETKDGFISHPNGKPLQISNAWTQMLSHQWRATEDAIMVGTNTALNDNPKLNVRHWSGRDPMRVVVDKNLKMPETHHLLDKTQNTLVYNCQKEETQINLQFIKLDEEEDVIPFVLKDLFNRKIQSLIVEGGGALLNSFFENGLWDEAHVFQAPFLLGEGIKAPQRNGILVYQERLEDNVHETYLNNYLASDTIVG
jgi:diaminohydroxyphosphoribosylaminopyrimidine deaminase / 5-amino-6-(5-phosphoribosylamino)uracil reductase